MNTTPTSSRSRLKMIEFFCGIGGCASAVGNRADILWAVDQNRLALKTYQINFPHPTCPKTIESLPIEHLHHLGADLWWCSPPCQPFTIKGRRRDLDDPRTSGLVDLMAKLDAVQPHYFAMENVPGFRDSSTHVLVRKTLRRRAYDHILETVLCPTQLGIPNRRPRFYLLAARSPLPKMRSPNRPPLRPLTDFIDAQTDKQLMLKPAEHGRFRKAIHVIDPEDKGEVARCFTSSYGCSTVRSGSYVVLQDGRVRYFSPREIARLLGFSDDFVFADELSRRQKWRLLGNSLSVNAVGHILSHIPQLA